MNRTESKIVSKLEKIARKGKTNRLEYVNYVNDLINKGQYSLLIIVLDKYFQINVSYEDTVSDVIRNSWERLLRQSNGDILVRIKRINDQEGVYQIGQNIYSNDNILLGELYEIDQVSNNFKYYVKNKEYGKLKREFKTTIKALRIDNVEEIFDSSDLNFSEQQNYIKRYIEAIKFLKTINI